MKKKIGLTVLALFIIVLAGVCGYGYHYYTKYVNIATIYPGVKIAGIDVSGMTKEEAQKTVDDYVNTVSEQKVTLQVGKKEKSFLFYVCRKRLQHAAAKRSFHFGASVVS